MLLMKTNYSHLNQSFSKKILTRFLKVTRIRLNKFPFKTTRLKKGYLGGLIHCHLVDYPTPLCLSYAWSFGSLAGICLVIQIISGSFLSIHYVDDMNYAFQSVQRIMRDVPNGWLIRYIHSNGASMFFIVLYCHIFRGLYYGSYMKPRQSLWCSGVVLFILVMGAAFTGYVLPWGQMSFWGATVITSMVTILPGGQHIAEWIWGGYTANSPPTIKRFYSIHFILPFIISGGTLIHLALLHRVGSTSPIGSDTGVDDIPFYPYYFAKDLYAFTLFLLFFAGIVLICPEALNHPTNYIPADPMKTPKHLVPEWYFLPFYAILRSIPHKTGGVIAMGAAIVVLFFVPFNYTGFVRNTTYRPIFKIFYWFLVADFAALFYIGQAPIKDQYMILGQYAAAYYYSFFILIVPVVGIIENKLAFHKDDSEENQETDASKEKS